MIRSEATQAHRSDSILVTGAAGFIGRHLVERLRSDGHSVVGIDKHAAAGVTCMDAHDLSFAFLQEHRIESVWHLAANADIVSGQHDAAVDRRDTLQSTLSVLSAMREAGVRKLVFTSSSAVYGEHSEPLNEASGPLFPISNYGAAKLASEAFITAATESFLDHCWIFRLANIVGPDTTHGLIFDLLNKLRTHPDSLDVLGDGFQRKQYLHIEELLDAMLLATERAQQRINCFVLGPEDDGISVAEIVSILIEEARQNVAVRYGRDPKGWPGDVPCFVYSIEKIKSLGWQPRMSSRQAIVKAVREVLSDTGLQAGEGTPTH